MTKPPLQQTPDGFYLNRTPWFAFLLLCSKKGQVRADAIHKNISQLLAGNGPYQHRLFNSGTEHSNRPSEQAPKERVGGPATYGGGNADDVLPSSPCTV